MKIEIELIVARLIDWIYYLRIVILNDISAHWCACAAFFKAKEQSAHSLISLTKWVLVSISSVSINNWVADDIFAKTVSKLECIKLTGFWNWLLEWLELRDRPWLRFRVLVLDGGLCLKSVGLASLWLTFLDSTTSSTISAK